MWTPPTTSCSAWRECVWADRVISGLALWLRSKQQDNRAVLRFSFLPKRTSERFLFWGSVVQHYFVPRFFGHIAAHGTNAHPSEYSGEAVYKNNRSNFWIRGSQEGSFSSGGQRCWMLCPRSACHGYCCPCLEDGPSIPRYGSQFTPSSHFNSSVRHPTRATPTPTLACIPLATSSAKETTRRIVIFLPCRWICCKKLSSKYSVTTVVPHRPSMLTMFGCPAS